MTLAITAGILFPVDAFSENEVDDYQFGEKFNEKANGFLEGEFRIGFYIYPHQKRFVDHQDVYNAIQRMRELGFNYLYVAVGADDDLWQGILNICKKLRVAVIPQLDFAYLTPTSDIERLVQRAVPFIKKYKDHPSVLAFSVREEPGIDCIVPLQAYYKRILDEVPDAPLHLVFNSLQVMKDMNVPFLSVTGTDRYPFWWEFNLKPDIGRATPDSALTWFHTQLNSFYSVANRTKMTPFESVITASTLELFRTADTIPTRTKGLNESLEERKNVYDRIVRMAERKNQGWFKVSDSMYGVWKYYRPPINCTSAMAWLSVMEGASSVSTWAWSPMSREMQDKSYLKNPEVDREYISSIIGRYGDGTPQLLELSEFAHEVRPFGKLFSAMRKDSVPVLRESFGAEEGIVGDPSSPTIEFDNDRVKWRSFNIPNFKGKVVVAVNTNVGEWSEGKSPKYLLESDLFRIDDEGNLIDYVPYINALEVEGKILASGYECFDLMSGKPVPVSSGGSIDLSIRPGRGAILFLTPRGSAEYQALLEGYLSKNI